MGDKIFITVIIMIAIFSYLGNLYYEEENKRIEKENGEKYIADFLKRANINAQKNARKDEIDKIENAKLTEFKNNWVEKQKLVLIENLSLLEIIKNQTVNSIDYRTLLSCFEWKYKRLIILVRDEYRCFDCEKSSDRLHIHHKYYLKDALPWEIDEEGLVALCSSCHTKRHKNEQIKAYQKVNNSLEIANYHFQICNRCNGAGHFPEYEHIERGICFKCRGNNVHNSLFFARISKVSNQPNEYGLNQLFDESINFLNSISVEFYKNNILHKLENPDVVNEADDLPF